MSGSIAATQPAPSPQAATSSTSSNPLDQLSGNFTDFLNLLMTQMQNQDPSSPMDTDQFTTQLVQFTGVEQQINTNAALNTLIEATQGNTLLQSGSLIGQPLQVTSNQLSLQNGKASLDIKPAAAGPINIQIADSAGTVISSTVLNATAGTNSWSWNGATSSGTTMPDGAYKVSVTTSDGAAVPFTVLGTATGVQRSGTTMTVALGGLDVDFAAVQSIGVH